MLSAFLSLLLLMPIYWGLFMFYIYWDRLAWRPAMIMGVLSGLSGIVIAVHWMGN